ncbi:response regulator [Fructobacillus fructosus]|uniref:response regulator transcription factor n=1 Tax=Fructobacillus fructosus TaxID=1631 RepID=UPI000219497E|nr:response regulator transcription factor [Fructobacillus fructosus]KRN52806.1 Response regulator (CheY-like receiver domain and HTH-typeDNA-binding domain) [Fructobacillus fructosus KCTC 3544]GAP01125.1 response regulator [Fructobacillus fructosus]
MNVLIVDDHMIVREGLKLILENADRDFQALQASKGQEAINLLKSKTDIKLILLDIKMEKVDGIEVMRFVSSHCPEIPVIVLTTYDTDEVVKEMLALGAKSFLLKDADSDKIIETISQVLAGNTVLSTEMAAKAFRTKNDAIVSNARLTERQQDILDWLVAGFRNKEIADKIFVSERTVKNELTQIYNQFGVSSRSEAVAFAFKYGLVNE